MGTFVPGKKPSLAVLVGISIKKSIISASYKNHLLWAPRRVFGPILVE
jgi:hypothetical protein